MDNGPSRGYKSLSGSKLDGAEVAICRPLAKHMAALVLLSKGQIILDRGDGPK